MTRQGMMLSALNEEMLANLRHIFYHSAGIEEDGEMVFYGLKSIVTYGNRGWAFDQRLAEGFKMIFQHYCVRADKTQYEKYDHVIYIDIEAENLRTSRRARQQAYEENKEIAVDATKEIEAYLVKNALAVEIQVGGSEQGGGRRRRPR